MCLGGQNSSCSKFHSNFKFYSFKSRVCLSLSLKSTFVSLFPFPLLHSLQTLKIAAPLPFAHTSQYNRWEKDRGKKIEA
ncbi:hypothetical protein HanRHA438_Chr16g0767451 [Helianthus annuus]|nr:hypothetical protein HanRHA438_Chr16g0767451 [Helianthus annuus]